MTFAKSCRFTLVASLFLIGLCLIALPSVGKAANDKSNARYSAVLAQGQELREGFSSLFTVPNGIYGSYEFEGKIIFFETRRGDRTPKYLRDGDPATPKFEIDVRFMNQDGESFLTQIGGDTPLDQTWSEALVEGRDDAQAKSDFELASRAIEEMRKLKFNRQFNYERKALMDLAPVLESAQVIEKEETSPGFESHGPTSPGLESEAPLALDGYTYRHRIQIHHKKILFGLARHSATIGKHISPAGVVTTAFITCNHGTCANQMALKCLWTSAKPGDRNNRLKNWVACTTPYNATSVFGHNSNDDTDLQYQAVRYNYRPSFTEGICNNSSINNAPTDCY